MCPRLRNLRKLAMYIWYKFPGVKQIFIFVSLKWHFIESHLFRNVLIDVLSIYKVLLRSDLNTSIQYLLGIGQNPVSFWPTVLTETDIDNNRSPSQPM